MEFIGRLAQSMPKREGAIAASAWVGLAFLLASGVAHAAADLPVSDAVAAATGAATTGAAMPWWAWPTILLLVTFVLGIAAVLGGVGGGVLFVPVVAGFFPFHLDFVRGAGLLVALAAALAAGPGLLRKGMADLRLAVPAALIASTCAIVGARVGLALPTRFVQIALGVTILGIVALMLLAKKSEYPAVETADPLSSALRISGVYHEPITGQNIDWKIHRTLPGLATFVLIGMMAGMFGLGAGWANVPALNLVMGAPLKVSVATSKFLLSVTDTSAAWIYVNEGAVLPMLVAPSIVGVMLGKIVGVRILAKTRPTAIRYMVIGLLLFASVRALLKGLAIWE
jgi:hypothetical protein